MLLSDTQIERWRLLHEEARSDAEWIEFHRQRDKRRLVAQRELLELLARYLGQQIDTEQFRSIFDSRTRGDWDLFGLKGMSGAMFLNMLVKHMPDQVSLTEQLRVVLPVPEDAEHGRKKLRRLDGFVKTAISSNAVTRRQVQPARIPFFVSTWWHLQNTERWPIFYVSARKAFELEGLYSPTQDWAEDYFAFCDIFLALASALDMKSWDLEHLCAWHTERDQDSKKATGVNINRSSAPLPPELLQEEETQDNGQVGARHTQVQWLLARIGRKFGCHVWIAANDHNRRCDGQRLGDLSLRALPSLGMDRESERIIQFIDVLWLRGANKVVAAFEVEQTTSIYSGLLRLSDLAALSPNLNFPLYIVAPETRMDKVRRELSRPTFRLLELHARCGFFSDEDLIRHADAIMRWANEPSAIERLASKVDYVSSEDTLI